MSVTSAALIKKKFFQCVEQFFPFESQPKIAVATSGGPDSLALCLLLKSWIETQNGTLIALTFDHGLRNSSFDEAAQVKKWLMNRGIEHFTIPWLGDKPTSDLQNKARIARYKHLEEWCEQNHILHLFLGHHRDDQEETVLQRLLHGSGPSGLQGIHSCTYRTFGRLLRPLLSFAKQQLIDFLIDQGQTYFSDPSNLNQFFERGKLRQIIPQLASLTNTHYPLTQVALKCRGFTKIAQDTLSEFLLTSVSLNILGFLKIDKERFSSVSRSLQILILSHCLQAIGGGMYSFSEKKLTHVLAKIKLHQNTNIGGCFIALKSWEIWIVREVRALPKSIYITDSRTYWDNRFIFRAPKHLIGSQIIPQAYLSDSPANYKDDYPLLPDYILKTLPMIQKIDKTIIKPLKSVKMPESMEISCRLLLKNKLTANFQNEF